MPNLTTLLAILEFAMKGRAQLVLENAALRHQLAVLKRSVTRAKFEGSDRIFWIVLRRMLKDWRDAVFLVKPDTVVRWHRNGFRYYRKRKSRSKPGRPPIGRDVIHLIKRISTENSLWGAPKTADELALPRCSATRSPSRPSPSTWPRSVRRSRARRGKRSSTTT